MSWEVSPLSLVLFFKKNKKWYLGKFESTWVWVNNPTETWWKCPSACCPAGYPRDKFNWRWFGGELGPRRKAPAWTSLHRKWKQQWQSYNQMAVVILKDSDIFSNKVGICNGWLDSLQVIAHLLKRIPPSREGTKFTDYSKLRSVFAFLLFLGFCKTLQIAPGQEMLGVACRITGAPWASRSSSSFLDVQGAVSSPLL